MAALKTGFAKTASASASRRRTAAPVIAALVGLGAAVAAPTQGFAAATFACHGLMNQICYFSVRHASAAPTDFMLRRGESRQIEDALAGVDHYVVTINVAPPNHAESCSRIPASAKRSTWCKLSSVSDRTND